MLPMLKRQPFIFILICAINLKNGNSASLSPKLDFGERVLSIKPSPSPGLVGYSGSAPEINLYEFTSAGLSSVNNEKNKKRSLKSNTIIINHNPQLATIDKNDETKPEINCDGQKCIITFIKDHNESANKNKKTSTDVHVKISTEFDQSKEKPFAGDNDDDDDIPIYKGTIGVDPKDIPTEENTFDQISRDVKEPSSLITVPISDNTNFMHSSKHPIQGPSLYLRPPIYKPSNWQEYIHRKDENDAVYHPYNINSGHNKHPGHGYSTVNQEEKNDIPRQPNFPPHNFPTSNFQGSKPNGWSNWKPIVPLTNPNDQYHYNGNNNGASGWNPHFVTSCTCSRHPVYNPRPGGVDPTPRPVYPWYPTETTTKPALDGKLLPPFN